MCEKELRVQACTLFTDQKERERKREIKREGERDREIERERLRKREGEREM